MTGPFAWRCKLYIICVKGPVLIFIDLSSNVIWGDGNKTSILNKSLKLPSLFAATLFWTFHNKLHNMKALVILSHHDHHFSHLFDFMKKWIFVGPCELLWSIFARRKLSTAQCFNIGAHIGIWAQISRNTLFYLPSLTRESSFCCSCWFQLDLQSIQ